MIPLQVETIANTHSIENVVESLDASHICVQPGVEMRSKSVQDASPIFRIAQENADLVHLLIDEKIFNKSVLFHDLENLQFHFAAAQIHVSMLRIFRIS